MDKNSFNVIPPSQTNLSTNKFDCYLAGANFGGHLPGHVQPGGGSLLDELLPGGLHPPPPDPPPLHHHGVQQVRPGRSEAGETHRRAADGETLARET